MAHQILIVDDAPHIRRMIEVLLQTNGYEVTAASDGLEAWNILQDWTPDLLISDVVMPRMDGVELVSRIRCDERLSHLRVMLLTAKGAEMPSEFAARQRLEAILPKPFSPTELQERVASVLGEEQVELATT